MSTIKFDHWTDLNGIPKGTIVQWDYYHHKINADTYVNIVGANATYVTPVTINFTPKFANSLIFVEAGIHTRRSHATPQYGVYSRIRKDGSAINVGSRGWHTFAYSGEQVNHHDTLIARCVFEAGQTTQMTLDVQQKNHSQSGDAEWSGGFGSNFIEVWEIQQ